MSLIISIRFLTGKAHLHHWQAHHSDGKVDWPPSPWRLLRALVAVAGRGLTNLPEPDFVVDPGKKPRATKKNPLPICLPEGYVALPDKWLDSVETADEISLSRLAALLSALTPAPDIWLPKTSGGHTRQFFPIHESGIVKNSGSAVFDTFAVVQKDQPVLFHWPSADFKPEDQCIRDLKLILQRMTYFGRAESWCHAEAHILAPDQIAGVERDKSHWPCVCIEDGGQPAGQAYRDYTLERKLASLSLNGNMQSDLANEATELLPRTNKISGNRPQQSDDFKELLQGESAETLLLRCLLRESGQDMRDGLDRPIGSRWVHYAVPRVIYDLPRPTAQRQPRRHEFVQIVRYALNTANVHRAVLPPLTDTLLVADKFRRAALHYALKTGNSSCCRNLLGREHDNSLCRDHDHAFFWPTDEDDDGFIDHVTVYCPRGFETTEVDALRRLFRISQRGGRPDLLVTPVYFGKTQRYRPWLSQEEDGHDRRTRLFVSATPYFCPVYLTHGRNNGGRRRPITPEILKGMKIQGIIANETEVKQIKEIVFDYAPEELTAVAAAIAASQTAEPAPPRQYFPVIDLPSDYPPLPTFASLSDKRFSGAFLKDPDDNFSFGSSIGLLVNEGIRFIRAMSFCRRRGRHELKGYGRMFLIEFVEPRSPRPFAIGDQCHFGLGMFRPVDSTETAG